MKKKLIKYTKFIISVALILSLIAPSYASLSASDGSAFVTKAEFDSALADFNSRLTTFEAGINSKIDSQVTSYLDRNGIWSGKNQEIPTGVVCWAGNKDGNDVFAKWTVKTNIAGYWNKIIGGVYLCKSNKAGLMNLQIVDTLYGDQTGNSIGVCWDGYKDGNYLTDSFVFPSIRVAKANWPSSLQSKIKVGDLLRREYTKNRLQLISSSGVEYDDTFDANASGVFEDLVSQQWGNVYNNIHRYEKTSTIRVLSAQYSNNTPYNFYTFVSKDDDIVVYVNFNMGTYAGTGGDLYLTWDPQHKNNASTFGTNYSYYSPKWKIKKCAVY